MARILVVEPVAQPGLDVLSAAHETEIHLGLSRADLITLLAEDGGWDALVVRSQTRVDAELLAAAAPRVSVVGVASVGIDRIDVEAATRAGVMIVNAPTGNTIAAAEHTMALMLGLLRHVAAADASVRQGQWDRTRYTGRELRGKTLGIIGLGKIGKAVARRATGFEMRVIASDPYLTEEQAAEAGAKLVGLAELLHRSDVITVHTPLAPQTRGLLGRAQLDATKPGTFVLNVARGGIVDEQRPRRCAGVRPGWRRRRRRLLDRADGAGQPAADGTESRSDAAPRRLDCRGTGSGRPGDGRAGRDGAGRRHAAVRGQCAVGRPRDRAQAPSLRRAGPPPGDPRPAACARRVRRALAHLRRRDLGRRVRADPDRRRWRASSRR